MFHYKSYEELIKYCFVINQTTQQYIQVQLKGLVD